MFCSAPNLSATEAKGCDTARVSISCILPTLSRGEVLCATIRMLLRQACEPREIIVVDQTPVHEKFHQQALASWIEERRITWLRQSEPNASKARNAGALAATGDVLL